jgi:hypothetical protein
MRQLFISILLSFSLFAKAQTATKELILDSLDTEIIHLPDSTAVGTPAGKQVSREIGPNGGSIISADGKVELIFPEGALKEQITISIQPISSLIPSASGNGYRFEPSGLKFSKPLELIFHYTKEEESICPAIFMFMAIQDDKGKWEYMDYDNWDSTKRILKGSIYHFSAMVNGNLVKLNIEDVEMKVGTRKDFALQFVEPPKTVSTGAGSGDDEFPALPSVAPLGPERAEWSVNGKKGGSATYGFINPERNPSKANYTAPELLNNGEFSTVEIKTYIIVKDEAVTRSGKRKGKMITSGSHREWLADLSCKVRLYDEYRLTVKVQGPYTLDCGAEIADSSNFNVKLSSKEVKISELQNRSPEIKTQANCPPTKYDVAGCVGPVHYNRSLLESYEFKAYPEVITMKFTPVDVRSYNTTGKRTGELNDFPGDKFDVNVGNVLRFRASRTNQSYEFGIVESDKEAGKPAGKKAGKKAGKEVPKVAGKNGYVLCVYPI